MIKGWIQKDDPSSINFLEIFLGKGKVGAWEIPVAVLEMGEVERLKEIIEASADMIPADWAREVLKILEGKE